MVKNSAYLVSTCQKSVKYFIFYFFFILFCLFVSFYWGGGGKKNMAIVEMLQKYKNIDQMGISSAVKS